MYIYIMLYLRDGSIMFFIFYRSNVSACESCTHPVEPISVVLYYCVVPAADLIFVDIRYYSNA